MAGPLGGVSHIEGHRLFDPLHVAPSDEQVAPAAIVSPSLAEEPVAEEVPAEAPAEEVPATTTKTARKR